MTIIIHDHGEQINIKCVAGGSLPAAPAALAAKNVRKSGASGEGRETEGKVEGHGWNGQGNGEGTPIDMHQSRPGYEGRKMRELAEKYEQKHAKHTDEKFAQAGELFGIVKSWNWIAADKRAKEAKPDWQNQKGQPSRHRFESSENLKSHIVTSSWGGL